MKRRLFVAVLMVAVVLAVFGTGQPEAVQAAAWPTRPINLIVPAAPGGGTDLSARLIAKYLTLELGQPVNITNISGGSGAVGLREMRNSAPDGYTFAFFLESTVTNQALGVMDFGYRDLTMIGNVFKLPMVLVGSRDIRDVATLQRVAKAAPGTVIFGGESGDFISLVPHILQRELDIQLRIVDGGDFNPRLALMVGGQINLTTGPLSVVGPFAQRGDLSIVAYFGPERLPAIPDVPTALEQGLSMVWERFQCIMAPAGLDPSIVARFNDALRKISQNPEFIAEATGRNIIVAHTDAAGLTAMMQKFDSDLQRFLRMVR